MSEDQEEKKHKPSQKKLEQLKKDGQFLRAREFYSATTLIAAILTILATQHFIYITFSSNFKFLYSHLDAFIQNRDHIPGFMMSIFFKNLLIILPIFLVVFIVFFLSVKQLGGLFFTSKNIHFNFERMNLFKNLKKTFSAQNAIELVKAFLKLIILFSIMFFFIKSHIRDFYDLTTLQNQNNMTHAYELMRIFVISLLGGVVIIAIADASIAAYLYHKKAMMTQQELKEESKETDGNPDIKRKIRQTQRALSLARLALDIPKATVIITNPTHYAIALRYHEGQDAAPNIIAKGVDHMAKHIRTLALKHAVPIYEAPELARAIYHSGHVGSLIHPDLYMAVALVLSYILQLKEYQMGRSKAPVKVEDLKIPTHFKQ